MKNVRGAKGVDIPQILIFLSDISNFKNLTFRIKINKLKRLRQIQTIDIIALEWYNIYMKNR